MTRTAHSIARSAAAFGALLLAAPVGAQPGDEAAGIAKVSLIVDTHIDVPYRLHEGWVDVTRATEGGDFDLPRARAGGLDVAFMSIYVPAEHEQAGGGWQLANTLIDQVEALAARAPEAFVLAPDTQAVVRAVAAGRIALALGMENGTPLEGKLANLQFFYDRGIRYITLAHSKSNHLSDSSYDSNRQWGGVSPFGRQAIAEMNRLGILIDVSHLSDAAAAQAIEASAVPVIASHSSARHFTPGWERNMSDELIRQLAARGGVLQINFGSSFLTEEANAWYDAFDQARDAFKAERGIEDGDHPVVDAFAKDYRAEHPFPFAKIADVVAHIDHVRDLVGIEHLGLGSDFDGVGDSLPEGLKDVSTYPALIQALRAAGYERGAIEQILGGNLMRVWRAAEAFAAAQRAAAGG